MKLVMIALVAANGVIGDGTTQPLSFAEDWARFKNVTMGHPLIVGRKTHEAMGQLPGRTSIVITSQPGNVTFAKPSAGLTASSLADAIERARELNDDVAFIAGGGEIYRQAMGLVDELDLSVAHEAASGSVTFPAIDPAVWVEVQRDPRDGFDFVRYARR